MFSNIIRNAIPTLSAAKTEGPYDIRLSTGFDRNITPACRVFGFIKT
jgi:hypothetical protein